MKKVNSQNGFKCALKLYYWVNCTVTSCLVSWSASILFGPIEYNRLRNVNDNITVSRCFDDEAPQLANKKPGYVNTVLSMSFLSNPFSFIQCYFWFKLKWNKFYYIFDKLYIYIFFLI